MVSLDFSLTYSFRTYHGPGVDSAPSENEYQEHFLGVKVAGAWGWQPYHLHVPNVMEIWEPKPPGTLWTTPGLLWDCFTLFYLHFVISRRSQWPRGQNTVALGWTQSRTEMNKEVKQSLYRSGQALRILGGWGSKISIHSAYEGGKIIRTTRRAPLPLRKYSWYSFPLEAMVRPEGCQWKIEPTKSLLVAQCLSQLRHRVPTCNECDELS